MSEPRRIRRRFARRRKYLRRRLTVLAAIVVLVVAVPLVLGRLPAESGTLEALGGGNPGESSQTDASQNSGGETSRGKEPTKRAEDDGSDDREEGFSIFGFGGAQSRNTAGSEPETPPVEPSPAAAAYAAVAPALPDVDASNVGGTYQSTDDPNWAVTEIGAPNEEDDDFYTVYSKKVAGGWEARRSVLANNPDYPKKGRAPLAGLPQDLKDALYPDLESTPGPGDSPREAARELAENSQYLGDGWSPVSLRVNDEFARVRLEEKSSNDYTNAYLQRFDGSWFGLGIGRNLTGAELSEFPGDLVQSGTLPEVEKATGSTSEPVLEGVSRDRREKVEEGVGEVRETVDDYDGTVGMYVQDKDEDWGYGIRPDERFYTASVIKVPVMAAVYRKIESGELSLNETVATEDRDYAGGAGGLQWQEESVSHTISDYLWMMIEQSDNVATNVLVRTVGGPEYVNEVAADLGAEGTELQYKVTDQRAAAPGLDNYTTPRDMATIMEYIATGEAANEQHTEDMLGLMRQTRSDSWLGQGLPQETEAACKVGWIGGVYNEVCLVEAENEPYIISVFSKYGPKSVGKGSATLKEISSEVWDIQKPEKPEKDKSDKESTENSEKDED